MFGFGKKPAEDNQLYAPTTGEVVNLETVSDPVFAQKMIGDGFGVKPDTSEATIVAPVAGEITLAQGHAVGIKRYDGLEVLIHLGIDTVSLKGAPFELKVKPGKVVKGGDPLVTVDWEQIKTAKLDNVVLVLITNTKDALASIDINYGPCQSGTVLGKAVAK
ncbi:PTS sugar transporter subunit IIA [Lapidilactobacillus bayanensis]|uniref:PTS sugar transporter subunit IIA n=1 Tax=Lapidilactobacillus bayanensis TaxID=2485998 RepID=UPI000F7A01D6|nr:PTS glucose transporter subunit IIA [Lapidilactobacillus bayanensis]